MEVITLCLLRPCFQEVLAYKAFFLCVARAAVLKEITDGIRKGGVIEIGNIKQVDDVIGTLSHSRSSSKKRRQQHKNQKNSSFLNKKWTAGSCCQTGKCKSVFTLGNFSVYRLWVQRDGTDIIVDGVL